MLMWHNDTNLCFILVFKLYIYIYIYIFFVNNIFFPKLKYIRTKYKMSKVRSYSSEWDNGQGSAWNLKHSLLQLGIALTVSAVKIVGSDSQIRFLNFPEIGAERCPISTPTW